MLDEQSGTLKSGDVVANKYKHKGWACSSKINTGSWTGDKGGASRFFYCAKSSKSERNFGCEGLEEKKDAGKYNYRKCEGFERFDTAPSKNNHPTVKPLKLMEYLCTLTKTPTGGIVLDPFAGSGSTGVACVNTNRDFIGIELDENYLKIAEKRINKAQTQTKLFKN